MATRKAIKKSAKKAPAKKAAVKKAVKKAPAKKAVKKKSAPKVSNIERLTAAGVIPQENVADHDQAVINKLSAAEVNTLIKLRKKLGDAPLTTKAGARPNFPV
ncbi:MAG TPA: aroma-sacti cluster domain-containing protein [Edaphobacter sp.]|nr:aroma-sacti cluster domain-containing protein [Edaphobacter sp.]